MMHVKKPEMVEINYRHSNLERVLSLAKDLLTFGIEVNLTSEPIENYCEISEPYKIQYRLTATTTKGMWMSVIAHRKWQK